MTVPARPSPPERRAAIGEGNDVAVFWDAEAGRYDRAYEDRAGRGGRILRRRLEAILELIGDGPGSLLDAGMGPARALVELERRGWTVSGIDRSPAMVALGRSRLRAASDRLLEGSIESIPFADESFDAVVASGVLEYVDYGQAALEELARVLRPGGLAVISIPNWRHPGLMLRRSLLRPLVRAAKQLPGSRRPMPIRGRPPPEGGRFASALQVSRFEVESKSSVYAADSLGRRRPGGDLLAVQFVFAARKIAKER